MDTKKLFSTPAKDLSKEELCVMIVLLTKNMTEAEEIIDNIAENIEEGYYGTKNRDDLILQIASIKQSLIRDLP